MPHFSPQTLGIINQWGTLVIGGLLGSVPVLVTHWVGKKSEEKKHRNSLVFDAAIRNWAEYVGLTKHNAERSDTPQALTPIEPYLFQTLNFFEVFFDKKFKEKDLPRLYSEHLERTKKIMDVLEKKDPSKPENR